MAMHSDDQQQLEAVKNWWKTQGKSLLLGGVLTLVGFGGYQAYTSYQLSQAESASDLYQELTQLINSPNKDSAHQLITRLTGEFSSSVYADYAHLLAARLAVEEDKLSSAQVHLDTVINTTKIENLQLIARLRLARILTAQQQADAALKLLQIENSGSFTVEFETLKGDLYISQGNTEEARKAYQKALDANQARGENPPLLELKLDNLPEKS